jgi:hypothetical protein
MYARFVWIIFCCRSFYTSTYIANIAYPFGVGVGGAKNAEQATLCEMLPVQEEGADEGGPWRCAHSSDGENRINKPVKESSWLSVVRNCSEYGGMTVCFTPNRKVFLNNLLRKLALLY